MATYAETLKRTMDAEPACSGQSREQLQTGIAQITTLLRGPMSDGERIELCAIRSGMRKALEQAPLTANHGTGEG